MLHPLKEVKFWKVLLLVGTGFLTFCAQSYIWPDSGKTIENKAWQYSFQINFWGENIHEKFNLIKNSGTYKNLSISNKELKIDDDFFVELVKYNSQLKSLNRQLRYKGELSSHILRDSIALRSKGLPSMNEKEQKEIEKLFSDFVELTKEYTERVSAIDSIVEEVTEAFYKHPKDAVSDEEKAELIISQANILKKLFSDDNYYMSHGTDPFKFVRELAVISSTALSKYELLLANYNEKVKQEQSIKNSLILLIAMLGMYLAFIKEYQST